MFQIYSMVAENYPIPNKLPYRVLHEDSIGLQQGEA